MVKSVLPLLFTALVAWAKTTSSSTCKLCKEVRLFGAALKQDPGTFVTGNPHGAGRSETDPSSLFSKYPHFLERRIL